MALTTREMLTGLPLLSAAAFFMQTLDATVLNTALPSIAADMHRAPFSMQMAVISYTLTVALLIPLSGWLSDRFGTRRVFLSAIALFAFGSFLCAISPNLPVLVVSRIIQGVGAAMMLPVSRLTLMKAYSRRHFVQVFNFITIPGLIGPIVGPFLGGWLVTYASWHWIFIINIPLGCLGLLYSFKVFPDFKCQRGPFDFRGFLLIAVGVLCFTAGLEMLGGKNSSPLLALLLTLTGLLFLFFYVLHARRHPAPLLNLDVFKTRTFSIGMAGNVVARLGFGSMPFLVPLFLQVGLSYSADTTGLLMITPAVASMFAKTQVLQLLGRFGYRATLLCLTLTIGVVFALMGLQQPGWPLWIMVFQLFIQGMLMSTQYTAMNTLTLGGLPQETASDGNCLLSMIQNFGLSLGVAVSTALLRLFSEFGSELTALHMTFFAVGFMTALAAFVFVLLRPADGDTWIAARCHGQTASRN